MSALTGDALYQGMAERPLHVVHAANEKVGSQRPGTRALRRFEGQAELVCSPASFSSYQYRTSAQRGVALFCGYPSTAGAAAGERGPADRAGGGLQAERGGGHRLLLRIPAQVSDLLACWLAVCWRTTASAARVPAW